MLDSNRPRLRMPRVPCIQHQLVKRKYMRTRHRFQKVMRIDSRWLSSHQATDKFAQGRLGEMRWRLFHPVYLKWANAIDFYYTVLRHGKVLHALGQHYVRACWHVLTTSCVELGACAYTKDAREYRNVLVRGMRVRRDRYVAGLGRAQAENERLPFL
jgi:hypothetical protein